jgi:RNA polymerase sigma factor for flagellar operon FliA
MADDRTAETLPLPVSNPRIRPSAPGARYGEAYRAELDETEMIKRYAPTVKRIAMHLKGRLPDTVQLDDLIQAGLITVLRLTRHAELPQTGDAALALSIKNAMIDEARRDTWAPVRTIRLAKAAGHAMRAIKRRTGLDAGDEEIATELGIPLSQYHQVLVEVAGIRLLNLDEFDGDSERALQTLDDQEAALDQSRVASALAEAIALLPDRERLVLSLYYEHELNMEEVGEVLGLNKSTICRTHGRAILMLRNALRDWRAAADAPPRTAGD